MARYRISILYKNKLYIAESVDINTADRNTITNKTLSSIADVITMSIHDLSINDEPIKSYKLNDYTTTILSPVNKIPFTDFYNKSIKIVNPNQVNIVPVLMSNVEKLCKIPIDLLLWQLLKFPIANNEI